MVQDDKLFRFAVSLVVHVSFSLSLNAFCSLFVVRNLTAFTRAIATALARAAQTRRCARRKFLHFDFHLGNVQNICRFEFYFYFVVVVVVRLAGTGLPVFSCGRSIAILLFVFVVVRLNNLFYSTFTALPARR